MCLYAFKGDGRYEFQRAKNQTLPSDSYATLKDGKAALDTIRKLVRDKRLSSTDASLPGGITFSPPAEALPLPEARQLQSIAIRNFRRSRAEQGEPTDSMRDEQVWGFLCGAILADLAWADMGSPLHLKGMVRLATTTFGVQI